MYVKGISKMGFPSSKGEDAAQCLQQRRVFDAVATQPPTRNQRREFQTFSHRGQKAYYIKTYGRILFISQRSKWNGKRKEKQDSGI